MRINTQEYGSMVGKREFRITIKWPEQFRENTPFQRVKSIYQHMAQVLVHYALFGGSNFYTKVTTHKKGTVIFASVRK